ncbi:adhesin [Rhizobium sp. 2YAF20]
MSKHIEGLAKALPDLMEDLGQFSTVLGASGSIVGLAGIGLDIQSYHAAGYDFAESTTLSVGTYLASAGSGYVIGAIVLSLAEVSAVTAATVFVAPVVVGAASFAIGYGISYKVHEWFPGKPPATSGTTAASVPGGALQPGLASSSVAASPDAATQVGQPASGSATPVSPISGPQFGSITPITPTPVVPVMPKIPATQLDFSADPFGGYGGFDNGTSTNRNGGGGGGGKPDATGSGGGSTSGTSTGGTAASQGSSTGASHHGSSGSAPRGSNGGSPLGDSNKGTPVSDGIDPQPIGWGTFDSSGRMTSYRAVSQDDEPVLLDISGNGLSINPLSSSSQFVDTNGDGYDHRTAWAGNGTGVLVLDADGNGKISNSSEYVFTQWDPTATSDLQAIKDVFDTNGNGKLDAGDARWSSFKVSVNGQLVSLDSLGITSIDLTPKGSGQSFGDGSAITGTTTYTKSDGSTGAVGDAAFATDANGYVISRHATANGDGSTNEQILGYDASGALAFQNTVVTSADGHSITTSFDDDGNGTFDRSQTDVSVVNADGTRTHMVANFNADGSLVNRSITTTSADRATVTTTVDQDGDGNVDQSQVFVTTADGSTTTTTRSFSVDGSTLKKVVVQSSADGLSKTTRTDINGDGVDDTIVSDLTSVASDGSRTRTVSNSSTNGTLLSTTTTVTSADSRTKTVSSDFDGNGTLDERDQSQTTIGSDGSVTITTSSFNGDGSVKGKTTTVTSADGLSKTASSDLNSDGVFDVVTSDVTVVAADNSRVETVSAKSANGTLLSSTVTTIGTNGKTTGISADTNGDGAIDRATTFTVAADGSTTQTATALNADGSIISKTISTTSADGLSKSVTSDRNGDGISDAVTTDVIVANADGSRTETVTVKSGGGSTLATTVTTTSADSLTQTVQADANGDGVFDQISTDAIVLNADGSRRETATVQSSNGTLEAKTITVVSADRRTSTVTSDTDGDGNVDVTSVQATAANGSQTTTTTKTSASGAIITRTTTVVSADGLTKTVAFDQNGDGTVDVNSVDQTVLNVDGSRVETVTTTSANGALLDKTKTTVSSNGLTVTTEDDRNGDGVVDTKAIQAASLNSDGSTTKVTSDFSGTALTDKTTTVTSANGLVSRSDRDRNGDGVIDLSTLVTKTINADGSTGEVDTVLAGNASLISKTTKTSSADGRSSLTTWDINGDGAVDVQETLAINAAGLTTDTVEQYKTGGALGSRAVTTTSATGLSKTTSSDLDGNGVFELVTTDVTNLNADGSQTRIISQFGANSVLTSRTTTTVSANGLTKTTSWADGSNATVRSSSDVTVLNVDGTTTETLSYFKADGSLESKAVTATGAHNLTSTVTSDANGDGVIDQRSVTTRNADGSVVQTLTDLASDGSKKDLKSVTVSANGLQQTTDYDPDGNGVVNIREIKTTVLNADGSKTTTTTLLNAGANGLVVKATTVVDTSADGLTISTKLDTTGSGTFNRSKTDVTTLNADGSKTQIVSAYTGTTLTSRYLTTTSANGLSIISKSDFTGSGTYSQTATDASVLNADGTVTRTISSTKSDSSVISTSVITTNANGQAVTSNEQRTGFATENLSDTIEVLADGATRETATTTDTAAKLLDKVVTLTSADKLTVTIDRDANGDGIVDQHQQTVRANSGILTTVMTDLKADGTILDRSTTTVSANGLQTTIDWDLDGNGTTDRRRSEVDTNNADGSRTSVISDTDLIANKLASKTTTSLSPDGTTRTTYKDVNGDGTVDQTDTLVLYPSGNIIDSVSNTATARDVSYLAAGGVYWKQAIAANVETDSLADGHSKTIKYDYDGDGVFETIMQSQLQVDGSVVTTVIETNTNGTTKAKGTITTSADGLTTVMNKDTDNDGVYDHIETAITHADGSVTLTKVDRNADNSLKQTVVDTVSALGSLTLRVTTDSLGHKTSQLVIAADGSSTTTIYDGPSGQQLSVSNANKAGILTSATLYDSFNAQPWTRDEQSFDASGKKTLEKQYNDDGTRTEITFNVSTGAQQHIDYFNASSVRTTSIDYDLANVAAWTRAQQNYDASGRVTYRAEFNDNGTETAYTYDPSNAQPWSSITQTFNTAAQLTTQTQYNDDGTRNVTTFDPTNVQSWSRLDENYDASGRLTYQLFYNDNGQKLANTYDATNVQSWSIIQQLFDTSGRLVAQSQYNDDGTRFATTYDVNNVQPYSRAEQTFDAAGRLTTQTNYNDDGTRTAYTWDVTNVQGWSSVTQLFNTAGQMTNQYVANDDGSQVQYTWDVANSQPWSYVADVITAGGKLATHYVYSDNTSQWTITSYDVNNNQPWTSLVQAFINSGHISTATSYNDDGSYTNYQYNSAGTNTAWQRYAYSGGTGHGDSGIKMVDQWPNPYTGGHGPVLLDLNGDGYIDLRPLDPSALATGSSVTFDWNSDGVRDGTAWVGPQDGFLAIDLGADGQAGADGKIDQPKELAFSLWASDSDVAANGGPVSDLQGLRLAFDSNHDGVLDAHDDRWSEFRVWRDANQNGVSDPGELLTMTDAGIKLINLLPTTDGTQAFSDGSAITGTSSYQTADGSKYLVADATLVSQPALYNANAA